MSSARLRHTINTLVGSMTPGAASGAAAVLDVFEQELDEYAELIVGPTTGGASPSPGVVGFMTRGEGAGFTERAAAMLQRFDMPPAARAQHRFLAELFEHKRAFFKIEWHRQAGGGVVPAAACYFRRRPELDTVLDALGQRGLAAELQDQLRVLAFVLDKRTVHFVAAAFRPNAPVHHKLYFSQYVTPATRQAVAARVGRLVDRVDGKGSASRPEGTRALWQAAHDGILAEAPERTIFVSVNFTDQARLPWLKIDYPEVTPAQAAAWVSEDRRAQVERDARDACAGVGCDRLSYLGVRLVGDGQAALKYYVDLPAPRELP
jgi:hypothetical protein